MKSDIEKLKLVQLCIPNKLCWVKINWIDVIQAYMYLKLIKVLIFYCLVKVVCYDCIMSFLPTKKHEAGYYQLSFETAAAIKSKE